ncbi:MAG: biotin/lipoyl-binding protein [Defluviitaleaceae bacterium]|nr:biotin/lipoyl-binding protein [Defluviitaleaceae bacterium]MCL2835720.1 biotin/lipoyl-binding protein [Defluviitaleaceae bacterium]
MKKYNVTVNGKSYEVEVEEIKQAGAYTPPVPVPRAAPAVQAAPAKPAAPIAPPPAAVPEGASAVKAPMPGTIMSVKVNAGDTVKRGDDLLILEAMKMENEIKADRDGTVAAVHVTQGASVNTGDTLISIG